MKIYDKEIFRKNEILKSSILLLFAFALGFATGYIANMDKTYTRELENKIQEQRVEIEELENNILELRK